MNQHAKLIKQLEIKAGMIEMGERIAYGSDSALMRQAAQALKAPSRPINCGTGHCSCIECFYKGDKNEPR
jgi:hypothetical protein